MTFRRGCMSSKFGQIGSWTTELAALEGQEKIPLIIGITTSYHVFGCF